MAQSRTHSTFEAVTNIAIGIVISWLAWPLFITPVLHVPISPAKNVEVTAFFTLLSFVRQYGLRRLWNWMDGRRT